MVRAAFATHLQREVHAARSDYGAERGAAARWVSVHAIQSFIGFVPPSVLSLLQRRRDDSDCSPVKNEDAEMPSYYFSKRVVCGRKS